MKQNKSTNISQELVSLNRYGDNGWIWGIKTIIDEISEISIYRTDEDGYWLWLNDTLITNRSRYKGSKTRSGQLIRVLREINGISQSTLSKECKVKQQYVSAWETGNRVPAKNSLEKLAKALKCKIDDLI